MAEAARLVIVWLMFHAERGSRFDRSRKKSGGGGFEGTRNWW